MFMGKKKYFKTSFYIILLLFNVSFNMYSETKCRKLSDTLIYWNSDDYLKWEDFKGKPDTGSYLKALTMAEVKAFPCKKGANYEYKVICRFIKNESWVKDTSAALLRHEQIHFDIAEVIARKMRKGLLLLKSEESTTNEDYKEYLDSMFLKLHQIQKKYDKETAQGTILTNQKKWEAKTNNQLKELERYSVNYSKYIECVSDK